MKLARKLTLAIVAAMLLVLLANAAIRVAHDRHTLREDIRRDHHTLGRALQVVIRESFREDGEERALHLVEAANQHHNAIQIRWLWLSAASSEPPLGPKEKAALGRGQNAELVATRGPEDWLLTYVPVRVSDGRLGSIEFAESLATERELMRATIVRTIVSTLLVAGLAALLTSSLGVWLVGRPVAQLMEKARRVGAGDLTGPIELRQKDELGDLAREMNAMCERLDASSHAREQAIEQLRHADRLGTVGRLAAGVAHELGTPLNVVSLEAKRIAVGRALGADAQESAHVIAAQAERMTAIIRQLLDYGRRRTRRPSHVSLSELARETLGLVGALATRQRIKLVHRELAPAFVTADAGQLQQVLMNLLVNALQASASDSEVAVETGREVTPQAENLPTFLRVIDTGNGITAEDLPRVFDPFFTTKDVGQGTGLGLAVAHGIVDEHGGIIEAFSEPHSKTVFTVRLPDAEAT